MDILGTTFLRMIRGSSEAFRLSILILGRFSGIFGYEQSDWTTNSDKNLTPLQNSETQSIVQNATWPKFGHITIVWLISFLVTRLNTKCDT